MQDRQVTCDSESRQSRREFISFRADSVDRARLEAIAARERRTISETVLLLVRRALSEEHTRDAAANT